uniref:Uncharacterized protein n=1 Tax=Trypanosoma vivax (strain Y486) TaxID=1055687 RepID=G0TRY5_TRYVY|nr:hypothetical protein, unlikely [Trypanosoma vivax Y486]
MKILSLLWPSLKAANNVSTITRFTQKEYTNFKAHCYVSLHTKQKLSKREKRHLVQLIFKCLLLISVEFSNHNINNNNGKAMDGSWRSPHHGVHAQTLQQIKK